MKTQPIESFNELCTTALEITKRLDNTGTKVWKDLINEQLNMVKMGVDYGNRQFRDIVKPRNTGQSPCRPIRDRYGVLDEVYGSMP